jgi:hypothetical protein
MLFLRIKYNKKEGKRSRMKDRRVKNSVRPANVMCAAPQHQFLSLNENVYPYSTYKSLELYLPVDGSI